MFTRAVETPSHPLSVSAAPNLLSHSRSCRMSAADTLPPPPPAVDRIMPPLPPTVDEVLVDPVVDTPEPLQIIKTGDANEDYFVLQEDNLNRVLSKVPPDMKVAVIAVVGAFRSGKSFLLNFFLRYLRSGNVDDVSQAWLTHEGENLSEGNMNANAVNALGDASSKSFAWKGGAERTTTGIWMWSEPFIRSTTASNGEKMAILLMDTQGMFDNETTMTLTAQIFGLSTLVSSFQIYNVDKRVQEDNLQHLALFSEYGRMALTPEAEEADVKKLLAATAAHACCSPEAQQDAAATSCSSTASTSETTVSTATEEPATTPKAVVTPQLLKKPFQRLQFLVRDWQNFSSDYGDQPDSDEWFASFVKEMNLYIEDVLRSRHMSDLQSTREQISRCFEKVDCFQLPHPGPAVTKIAFDGLIQKIDPDFRGLINRYVRLIFDQELEPKEINHRQITGRELKAYFEVYAKMFQNGEKTFPKAMTMLDATSEANNRNAHDIALAFYKAKMDALVGEGKGFVKELELTVQSDSFMTTSLTMFDEIATMGAPNSIAKCRSQLVTVLDAEKTRYFSTNALRNPFKDIELYIVPLIIAVIAWVLSVFTDKTCSTDFCESVEDTFVNVYLFVFFGVLVLAWKQIRGIVSHLKDLTPLIIDLLNKKN